MPARLKEEDISNIRAFEILTKARVSDYIAGERELVFVVSGRPIGEIIGRGGARIRQLEARFKKRVRLFQDSPNLSRFVRNLVGVRIIEMKMSREEGKRLVTAKVNKIEKPLVLGRNGSNLEIIREILNRRGVKIEIA